MVERIHWRAEHDRVKAELEEKLEDAGTACEALRTELEEAQTALEEAQLKIHEANRDLETAEREVRRARLEGAQAVAAALLELERL